MIAQDSLGKNKETDLRILCALLAMGGRSNREIAKILGMTNVTVSRRKKKIEREGYINEYTAIPNFTKMGLEYIIFTFTTSSGSITPQEYDEIKKKLQNYPEIIWVLHDNNLAETQWVAVSVHKDYESYLELSKEMQKAFTSKLQPNFNILMFHTAKDHPKPLSFRNFSSLLLKPEKSSDQTVGKKRVKKSSRVN